MISMPVSMQSAPPPAPPPPAKKAPPGSPQLLPRRHRRGPAKHRRRRHRHRRRPAKHRLPTSPTTHRRGGGGSTTATFAEEGGREPRWLVPAALPNEYDCATCCKSRIQTSNAASGEFRLIMPPKSDEEVAAIFSVGNKAASSPGTTKTPSEVSPGFLKVGGHLSTGTGCLSSVTSEENLRKFLLH